MNDDPPGDQQDRSDEQPADRPAGGLLSQLLATLDRLGDVTASDRHRSDRTVVDYSISARSALEDLESRRGDARGRDTPTEQRPSSGHRTRTRRRYEPTVDSTVTARAYDDELLVTADLASVDPDDIRVGFDGRDLVIGVEGRELERVRSPWGSTNAEAAIHNGILTVRVVPPDDE